MHFAPSIIIYIREERSPKGVLCSFMEEGMKMITVSLCMIVRDEEAVLERCLESVKDAVDEIVIVDTGSEDRTKEKAGKYTDKVYDLLWQDDFSAARNFAFSKGTMEYLMWLDADDVLPEESASGLKKLKESLPADIDMVMMPYAVAFETDGTASFSYYRERIVRNRMGFVFEGRVHEVIPPAGNIYYADIPVEHRKVKAGDSKRNLRIYEKMEQSGEAFDSRALYYYGRELYFHGQYQEGIRILEEFLDRPDGWVENRIDATRQLAGCLYGLGEEEEALRSLLRALEYDVPRGETCCDLGSAKKEMASGAFIREECYGFLPAVSLCVCYDRMGDMERAEQYNEMAGKFRPESEYYLMNKNYFEQKRQRRE